MNSYVCQTLSLGAPGSGLWKYKDRDRGQKITSNEFDFRKSF